MIGFHESWKIYSPCEQLKNKTVYNVSYIKRNIETSYRSVTDFQFRIIRSYFFKTILLLSSHLVDLHVKCSLFLPDFNENWSVSTNFITTPPDLKTTVFQESSWGFRAAGA
jgi:hypothetical protein